MQALTGQMKIGSSVCCCAGSVPAVLPRAGAVLHALWRQDPGPHPRLLQKWPRLQCGSLDAAGRCSVQNRGPHGSRSRPVNPGAFAGSTRAVLRVRPADQTPRVRKRESLPSTRFLRCPSRPVRGSSVLFPAIRTRPRAQEHRGEHPESPSGASCVPALGELEGPPGHVAGL